MWKRRVKELAENSTFKKLRSWHWYHHFIANRWGKSGKSDDYISFGSKITVDSDCNHKIKRHLLLGRKAMKNLDSILKSRDTTLPTKIHKVKVMVFPVVIYGCKSWTIKKSGNRTALWPSNPTAGHTHRRNQNWKRHVYPSVHLTTVYNSQDIEAT